MRDITQRHGPLACAIAINGVLIALGGLVIIRSSLTPNEDAIEVSLGTEGFLTEDTSSSPPTGGESAAQAVLEQAAQQMMTATPTPAVPTDLTAITTMANTALAFDVKPPAPSLPSIGVPTIKAPTVASGTGTGTGEGQGTGNGNGTGTGTGSGTGTDTGNGIDHGTPTGRDGSGINFGKHLGNLHIQGSKIGIIHDVSGSMGDRIKAIRKIAREQMRSKLIIKSIPHTALFVDPANCAWDCFFGDYKQFLSPFQELADRGVDAIYLVTDLMDGQDEEFMQLLERILIPKGIRLYVTSSLAPSSLVQGIKPGHPQPPLLRLIQKTGGAFQYISTTLDLEKALELALKLEDAKAAVLKKREPSKNSIDSASLLDSDIWDAESKCWQEFVKQQQNNWEVQESYEQSLSRKEALIKETNSRINDLLAEYGPQGLWNKTFITYWDRTVTFLQDGKLRFHDNDALGRWKIDTKGEILISEPNEMGFSKYKERLMLPDLAAETLGNPIDWIIEQRIIHRGRDQTKPSPQIKQKSKPQVDDFLYTEITVQGVTVTLLPHGQLQWANNNTGTTSSKQTRSESMGPDGKVTQESSTIEGEMTQDVGQRQGGSWKLNDANQVEVTLPDGEVVVVP